MARKLTDFSVLPESEILSVACSKKPGRYTNLTWFGKSFKFDGKVVKPIRTWTIRIGLKTKEADYSTKVEKKRKSSYTRLKDEDGKLVDPFCVLRNATTQDKKYLQVWATKNHSKGAKSKSIFFIDGEEVADKEIIKQIIEDRRKKTTPHDEDIPFSIAFENIIKIK